MDSGPAGHCCRAASAEVPESLIMPTSYWTGAMDQADWMPTRWMGTDDD